MARPDDDEEPVADKDAELEGSRMPFLSHLRELRDRVRNAAIAFVLAFGVCFYFAQEIYDWLQVPIERAWATHTGLPPFKMNFATLTEPFWVNMSVALWAGIFVASPFIFHQIWKFIAPGLYKRERRIGVTFAVFSAIFFVGGAFELMLKAGEITEDFGYAKTIAFDLAGGADIAFTPRYGMRVAAELNQVGFSFSSPKRGVSGATDRTIGLVASFEVLY